MVYQSFLISSSVKSMMDTFVESVKTVGVTISGDSESVEKSSPKCSDSGGDGVSNPRKGVISDLWSFEMELARISSTV